jgi:hypothetical protein
MMTNPEAMLDMLQDTIGVAARDIGNRKISPVDSKAETQQQMDTILEYLADLGIFNDSVRTGPVRELLTKVLETQNLELLGENTYMDQNFQPIEGVMEGLGDVQAEKARRARTAAGKVLHKTGEMWHRTMEKPMAAFRLEDEAVKALAFMVERRRHAAMLGRQDLLDIIDGKTQPNTQQQAEMRDFDQEVASYITGLYPTYSRVPSGIRAMSRNIFVTPFPSFSAEMWRNGYNDWMDMLTLARGEGRYEGIPAEKRMALFGARTATTMAYYTMVGGIVSSIASAGISSLGVAPTDDDLERARVETQKVLEGKRFDQHELDSAVRVISPSYVKNSIFQITDFKPGETMSLRALAFTIPVQQQLEAMTGLWDTMELLVDEKNPERAARRLLATMMHVAGDYVKPDVLAATAKEIVENKTGTGSPIYRDDDTTFTKTTKSMAHLAKIALPGSRVWREGEKFTEAFKEGRLTGEAKEYVLGVSDTEFRIDSAWKSEFKKLENDPHSVSNSNTKINRLIRSNEDMSDDEFLEEYMELEKARHESFVKYRHAAMAGQALGLTQRAMQNLIADDTFMNNPGDMDIKDLLRTNYRPYEPDKDTVVESYYPKDAHKLSPREREAATKAATPIIKHRLRLVRAYKNKVRYQDYDL